MLFGGVKKTKLFGQLSSQNVNAPSTSFSSFSPDGFFSCLQIYPPLPYFLRLLSSLLVFIFSVLTGLHRSPSCMAVRMMNYSCKQHGKGERRWELWKQQELGASEVFLCPNLTAREHLVLRAAVGRAGFQKQSSVM